MMSRDRFHRRLLLSNFVCSQYVYMLHQKLFLVLLQDSESSGVLLLTQLPGG